MKYQTVRLTFFGRISVLTLIFILFIGIPTYKFVMNPYRIMKRAFTTMNIDQLNRAIERGADVNRAIKNVYPIILSLRSGNYDFVEALAQAGANLNLTHKGISLAGQVAATGDSLSLAILGKYGADFHAKADSLGRNVLTGILVSGKQNLLPVALKYTERNRLDATGKPPLHYVDFLDSTTLHFLVHHGEDINAPDHLGNSPLHTAKSLVAAQNLHRLGADINATNNCGVPAIFYQVGNGNGRVYHYMLQNGAQVNTTDDYGQSILTYAMMTSNELLHRQVADNYCEYYPANCAKAQKHLKNAGIKALATVIYTKTAQRAILGRIAASQAAKVAVRRSIMKGVVKRVIPLIGGILTAIDLLKVVDAVAEYDRQIKEHRAEAERLKHEREEAQEILREQFLNCNVQAVPFASRGTPGPVRY